MGTTTIHGTAHASSLVPTETLLTWLAQTAELLANVQATLISCTIFQSTDASGLCTLHAMPPAVLLPQALKEHENQNQLHLKIHQKAHQYQKSGHATDAKPEMNATLTTANFAVIATTQLPITSGAKESSQTTQSFQSLEKSSTASATTTFGGTLS